MDLFGVVNMDIVGSRNIKERSVFQRNLVDFINQMNIKYLNILAAPINLTLGDEWQIVLKEPSDCYHIIHEFQKMLWENDVDAYAGIGIGEITTQLYDDTRMMDGPCFIMARKALDTAKRMIKTEYKNSKLNKVFLCLDQDYGFGQFISPYSKIKELDQVNAEVAAASEGNIIGLDEFSISGMLNLYIENTEILKGKMTRKTKRNLYQIFGT